MYTLFLGICIYLNVTITYNDNISLIELLKIEFLKLIKVYYILFFFLKHKMYKYFI